MNDTVLSLKNIEKSFGETPVLRGVDLDIAKGEFITILGSSGCGKTTLLRIIAGLIDADEGTVYIDGKDVTNVSPEKRPVNTVFQNYALFPHMTVAENVGYALKLRGVKKDVIASEVSRVLSLVRMSGYEKRRPHELSGGQKQRVAIARAVIAEPKVLLLDEPLGALDLRLRRQMQTELKSIQSELGITFVYITHDQEEALNMSSRVAVMRDGVFEQLGTPDEIYDSPETSFVASFVGEANVIRGKVMSVDGDLISASAFGNAVKISANGKEYSVGDDVCFAIRRENVLMSSEGGGIPAKVCEKIFAGGTLRIVAETNDGKKITSSRHGINSEYAIGDTVYASWAPENAVIVRDTDTDDR